MGRNGLASRVAALDVVMEVRYRKKSLNKVLETSDLIRKLTNEERSFANNLILTTFRRLGQIDDLIAGCLNSALKKTAIKSQCLLQIGVCQLLFLKTSDYAAVSTTVELAGRLGCGHHKNLINAVLRRLQREGEALIKSQNIERLNTPNWLWDSWKNAYGLDITKQIATANLEEPPVDISFKLNTGDRVKELKGIKLPCGTVRCKQPGKIQELPGFKEGEWWVQSSASRQVSMLLGDVKGKTVIDMCAAPGGKTIFLACAGGIVTAIDRSALRLERLNENLKRMNVGAKIICEDSLKWRPKKAADFVLLDAPCSATGIIRRHPDIAHLKSQGDVNKLASVQEKLLDAAVEMLSSSGVILFSTCSLQDEEGPHQVKKFLARHQQFKVDPIRGSEIFMQTNPSGVFRSLPLNGPDLYGQDGFFAARFRRR